MKITIITVTLNSASTLRSTIESILSQSYQDWEHIIVDGGSVDATCAIANDYAEAYRGRLRLVSGKDSGPYCAMNRGLQMATGDVVGMLNSDDFYASPTVLEEIAKSFAEASENGSERPVEAVYGDVVYVERERTSKVVRYYSSCHFKRSKMRMGFMPAHPSFYCRRDVYDRFGNFDERFATAADFELLLRMVFKGKLAMRYLPMVFVKMRLGGITSRGIRSHLAIFCDHRRAYVKNRVYSGVVLDALRYPCRIAEYVMFKLRGGAAPRR